jgi:DNA-binding NarL/FixJ family response regulator
VTASLRIAIADDHTLLRQGLKSLLTLRGHMSVVAEAAQVADLLPMLARTPCDILLLDLQMDRNSLSEIAALVASVKVIVVTASERPEGAVAAMAAGARGVVFKCFAVDTLIDAVRAVAAGQVWMPPTVQAQLAAALRAPIQDPLSVREREVVQCVARGLRNAEVAQRLFISEQTVKTHLNNIFHKLELRDRVELALYAVRVGLIGVHERPL